jgi:thioredoxin reductase
VGGGDSAVEAAITLAEQQESEAGTSYRRDAFRRIKPGNHELIGEAMANGSVNFVWESTPQTIESDTVLLEADEGLFSVPADQVFIFAGGVVPTNFLRNCGIEIETKFGRP